MWIVFGTKDASRRVPNGAQVTRHCDSCGETAVFYEKDRTSTFRLYFIDVFDYRKTRVMQCGACGASYATDELGSGDVDWATTVEKKLHAGSEAIGKFATSVGDKLTDLSASLVNRPPPRRVEKRPPERVRPADEDLSDDDKAALEELDELEAKFRALEKEDADKKKWSR
jgi:hypothetical protein